MKCSVVIPCYNEEQNIPLILKRFQEVIRKEDMELILVDNGSTDQTQERFRELLPLYPLARSIKIDVNQGYGYGIWKGLEAAKGDYLGWTHADMQTDPEDVVRAYHILKEQKGDCYVKGTRRGRPLVDNLFTFGMSVFEIICLKQFLVDINAQPNFFPRKFFESWEEPPYDFAFDLYAFYLAKKTGIPVIRFPVQFPKRIHGTSHWNTGFSAKCKFIRRTVDFSIRLREGGIR